MMLQPDSLPVGGGTLVAAIAWAGLSYVVTGPLVGERMIARSNWQEQCRSGIEQQVEAERTAPTILPDTDCRSILGGILPELDEICRQIGNPDLGGPGAIALREQERLRHEAEEKRIAHAAATAGSRCACASSVFIEEQRVALALHAGSARLVTPMPVKHLTSELMRTLTGPACSMAGTSTGRGRS